MPTARPAILPLILLAGLTLFPFAVRSAPPAPEHPGAAHRPVRERLAARTFPSIFQAWADAAPVGGADRDQMLARHDLAFLALRRLGLQWEGEHEGLSTTFQPASLELARKTVAGLREMNPNLVLLAEVRYKDAPRGFLPADSPWWKRDAEGQPVEGWKEGGFWEFEIANGEFQTQVARRCQAVLATGLFDGILLDWWQDADDARVALLRRVRETIGAEPLIMVNGNDWRVERAAPYVNGMFMECWRTKVPLDWNRLAATLRWGDQHLREPRVNCLETWFHQSRADLPLMRATTTIALTQSDGFALFSDPNPLPTADHAHDWYPFWDQGLGRPRGHGAIRPDAAWVREFEGGTVLYNPPDQLPAPITFPRPHLSRATGRTATNFEVPSLDGDIFVPVK